MLTFVIPVLQFTPMSDAYGSCEDNGVSYTAMLTLPFVTLFNACIILHCFLPPCIHLSIDPSIST